MEGVLQSDSRMWKLVTIAGDGPVVINAQAAPFADAASRLMSGVDEFLVAKWHIDFSVATVVAEVTKIADRLDTWRGVAPGGTSAVVVFVSVGHFIADKPSARGASGSSGKPEDAAASFYDTDAALRSKLVAGLTRVAPALRLPTVVVCRGCGLKELFGPLFRASAFARRALPPSACY